MATITWPLGLPQAMLERSLVKEYPENVIRSSMGAGPAKVRRRGTAGVTNYTGEYLMTAAELATFDTFFGTTTYGGALHFTWPGPSGGDSFPRSRFAEKPKAKPKGSSDWIVRVKIEVLP